MEKPDFVSKENFESIVNKFSDPLTTFEDDKRKMNRISHRIIDILCNENFMRLGNLSKTDNGYVFVIKGSREQFDGGELFNDVKWLINTLSYYHEMKKDIFDKYILFSDNKKNYPTYDLHKMLDELDDEFNKDFKAILGYTIIMNVFVEDNVKAVTMRINKV